MIETILSNDSPHNKTNDFRIKYKTEKCRYLLEKGYCPFSNSCTFAHSDSEVREKIHIKQNYKTKLCINFSLKGCCPYGTRCHYIHETPTQKDDIEEGLKTRSNSEESVSSKSSRFSKNSSNLWERMTHNKRIELIQNLGFDYAIRSSSRLLQLLRSNEQPQSQSDDWMFEEPLKAGAINNKKYSL